MSDSSSGGFGTSILGLLGVLFIGLKLTGQITWSWWWVLAPWWGGLLFVVIVIIGSAYYIAQKEMKEREDRKRTRNR